MKAQSLIIKKIDGFDVVTGFQDRRICPVTTQRKNAQRLLDMPETIALKAKNDVQNGKRAQLMEAWKKSKYFLKIAGIEKEKGGDYKKHLSDSAKQTVIRKNLEGVMGDINEELKVLSKACKCACQKVLTDNPVYNDEVVDPVSEKMAGPKAGEMIKTAEQVEDLKQKFKDKPPITQLLVSGDYIQDFRGKVYHIKVDDKWEKRTIKNLGDGLTPPAIFDEDLTATQKTEIETQEKADRIAALSPEERGIEYGLKHDSLLTESVSMRLKLEIKGATANDALAQSSEFYNVELDKLKLEYGVE